MLAAREVRMHRRPDEKAPIVVLSGAGLSKASGVPTFRDADGLWEGHRIEEVATPEAWVANPELVRHFYDDRRVNAALVMPNAAHEALARLQQRWGPSRVVLVTQNVDGLLVKAGAPEVLEMHGSLWRLRCEAEEEHPEVGVFGRQNPKGKCGLCAAPLRPAVVWFGEVPHHMDRIMDTVSRCSVFLSVGTSGQVYPAAGLVQLARARGARCIEVNPRPSGALFDEVVSEPAETALPKLIGGWLEEPE